jgi:hypothetical protein
VIGDRHCAITVQTVLRCRYCERWISAGLRCARLLPLHLFFSVLEGSWGSRSARHRLLPHIALAQLSINRRQEDRAPLCCAEDHLRASLAPLAVLHAQNN